MKFYTGGDYKSAIREFSAAQQLAPADLNNYNLALCYDKLGDPEPAIQYYRAYLDKVPTTDKRAEIEASISRLESASRSVAAKKAEEARKAEEAKKAAAEEARRLEDQRKADELAKKAVPPPPPPGEVGPAGPSAGPSGPSGPSASAPPPPMTGAGSTGTPSSGVAASTGDAQLDRVSAIDISAIRDQRMGGGTSGIVDNRGGPATQGAAAGGSVDPNAGQAPPPASGPQASNAPPQDVPKKATPVYKKWWFWAVVAVSAYVVYAIATEDSQRATREMLPLGPSAAVPNNGGMTLLRW